MKTVWKKFVAATAVVGLILTQVASAVVIKDNHIQNVEIFNQSFDPQRGDYAAIGFDVNSPIEANIEIRSVNSIGNDPIVATLENRSTLSASSYTYNWYGTVDNIQGGTPLEYGDYYLRITQYDLNTGEFELFIDKPLLLTLNPEQSEFLDVSNLQLSTSSVDFENGETLNISFDVNQYARVSVMAVDSQGNAEYIVTQYDGNDSYGEDTIHNIEWDGKLLGESNPVSTGDYSIMVNVSNLNNDDSATANFNVLTTGTPPVPGAPQINNFSVNPYTVNPNDPNEDQLTISFESSMDTTADVRIEDSAGNVVRDYVNFNVDAGETNTRVFTANSGTQDGTYTVYVTLVNPNSSTDTVASRNFEVSRNQGDEFNFSVLSVNPSVADQSLGEDVVIQFSSNQDVEVDGEIFYPNGNSAVTFNTLTLNENATGTYTWNTMPSNPNGEYRVVLTADSLETNGFITREVFVTLDDSGNGSGSDLIDDLQLNPPNQWDPADDELEIEFELTDDVDDLVVEARRGNQTVELVDDRNLDADDYDFTWDGYDEDDEYIEEGVWTIYVIADGETATASVTVDYVDPEINEGLVTKDEFDPEQDEFTHLLFEMEADAVVTVEVYDGSRRVITLIDEEEMDGEKWHAVRWDGEDDDGDIEDEGSYRFKITAESLYDNDLEDELYVNFDIEEDEVSSSRTNVTNDFSDPVIFDEDEDSTITYEYCLDDDAEVDVTVHRGRTGSGAVQRELLDNEDQSENCYTIEWDGEDDDGEELDEGVYSYKITARSDSDRTETEILRFVVGEYTDDNGSGNGGGNNGGSGNSDECGGYWDVFNIRGTELCEAIDWASNEGIVQGMDDGAFRPDREISRAEVLKVTLEAFEDHLVMLPADGTTLGFQDVDPNAWYMTYARTGKFYGMLHGYLNQTEMRPNQTILRAEFLKFALEASDAFTDWEVPGYETSYYADVDPDNAFHDWYFDYAGVNYSQGELLDSFYDASTGNRFLRPSRELTRGEAVLLLYRMNKNELLD